MSYCMRMTMLSFRALRLPCSYAVESLRLFGLVVGAVQGGAAAGPGTARC